MKISSNDLLLPQAQMALDQMKYEIASELGINIPKDGYYGNMSSRETGYIGGYMTRRLVEMGQQHLASQSNM